ncbi:hypothetical protein PoB_001401500 [Plakobranchus ocellatus]|uniref:Uncharacterized protein n=1 Tax=Plakobranchus ocellatus TaxID=259542 RepID=A0AAV3YX87_9GAST|nr:hypothetical protein PoB_001401500 [Plakobranchus ocellatus]
MALRHNAVCQEQSGPYSWFPDAWIKPGNHFTLRTPCPSLSFSHYSMQTQYCYQYLTLQTGTHYVWLGLLHTPTHPFSSATRLCSGTLPDTPYKSRSHQRKAKQILLHHSW